MSRTRNELIVKEAFISESTWDDLETLFSTNKKILSTELKDFFENIPSGISRYGSVCQKLESNERVRAQSHLER